MGNEKRPILFTEDLRQFELFIEKELKRRDKNDEN